MENGNHKLLFLTRFAWIIYSSHVFSVWFLDELYQHYIGCLRKTQILGLLPNCLNQYPSPENAHIK